MYRIQQLTTDHTVRLCTCISEADPDISITGGGGRVSETIYFRNIKRNRDVIQSENDKTL
jgi:hypothetical protein